MNRARARKPSCLAVSVLRIGSRDGQNTKEVTKMCLPSPRYAAAAPRLSLRRALGRWRFVS